MLTSAPPAVLPPGGKRRKLPGPSLEPVAATAARETEEETHWQLPAERVQPMLEGCKVFWCVRQWREGRGMT